MFVLLNRVLGDAPACVKEGEAKRHEEQDHQKHKPPRNMHTVVLPPVRLAFGQGDGRGPMLGGGWRPVCCLAEERIRRIREVNLRCAAMTQVVQQLGGFGRIDPARGEGGKDLRIGVAGMDHAFGKFHIGRKDFVYHK